jgi:hypothetical protein
MQNLQLEFILLSLLGVIIHVLMHVLQRKNKSNPISFKYFICDFYNWVRILLSVVSIFALLLMADDLASIMGVTLNDGSPAKSVMAFLCGYLNHSLINNTLKIFDKK